MAIILTKYYDYYREMGYGRLRAIWRSYLTVFLGVYESQEVMRFGPRHYSPKQARVIKEAVAERKPLSAKPLESEDCNDDYHRRS